MNKQDVAREAYWDTLKLVEGYKGCISDKAKQNQFEMIIKSATARHEEEIEKLSSLLDEAEELIEDFKDLLAIENISSSKIDETLQKIKEARG